MLVWQAAYELVNSAKGFDYWDRHDIGKVVRLGDLDFELMKYTNSGHINTDSWGDVWYSPGVLTAVFKVTDDAGNHVFVEKTGRTDSFGYTWDGTFQQVFPVEREIVTYDYV